MYSTGHNKARRRAPSQRIKKTAAKGYHPSPTPALPEEAEPTHDHLLTSIESVMARDIVLLLSETLIPRNHKLRTQLCMRPRAPFLPELESIRDRDTLQALINVAQELKVENQSLSSQLASAVEAKDATVKKVVGGEQRSLDIQHKSLFAHMNTAAEAARQSGGSGAEGIEIRKTKKKQPWERHLEEALADAEFNPFEQEELDQQEELKKVADMARAGLEEDQERNLVVLPSPIRRNSSISMRKEERRESIKVPVFSRNQPPTEEVMLEKLRLLPPFMQPAFLIKEKSKRAAGIKSRIVEERRIAETMLFPPPPFSPQTKADTSPQLHTGRHEILSTCNVARKERAAKFATTMQRQFGCTLDSSAPVPRFMKSKNSKVSQLTNKEQDHLWMELITSAASARAKN